MRKSFAAAALIAGMGAAAYCVWDRWRPPAPTYRTEVVARGELIATVAAVGTLQPEDMADVGAQVAGLIKEFGRDTDGRIVDFCSPVDVGTVLARIDDSMYASKVEQSRAQLLAARHRLRQAKEALRRTSSDLVRAQCDINRARADIDQAKAKADFASKDWNRYREVSDHGGFSQREIDSAQSAFDSGKAGMEVAEAALSQAEAARTNSEAAHAEAEAAVGAAEADEATAAAGLRQDEINLEHCVIRSNVKGIVIDRRVTLGQTLQSSQSIPSLFLIAKDLRKMKIWASVNESDIGKIREGQTVRFTVEAFPNRTFTGKVNMVRLNATCTQNVVIYTVEIDVDNHDSALKPYMTASMKFEIERRPNALRVSNAALRWRPIINPSGTGDGDNPGIAARTDVEENTGTVWTRSDGLRPARIRLGLTDGNFTEVLDDGLSAGDEVIVGELRPMDRSDAETVNPFVPQSAGKK